mmetsp:Transcript_91753/g.291123  ORF Transcript_91753/g.291123 Transcript_91753/m.291123 type:complete len:335 (+) Transcript_91753:322-1326(+)
MGLALLPLLLLLLLLALGLPSSPLLLLTCRALLPRALLPLPAPRPGPPAPRSKPALGGEVGLDLQVGPRELRLPAGRLPAEPREVRAEPTDARPGVLAVAARRARPPPRRRLRPPPQPHLRGPPSAPQRRLPRSLRPRPRPRRQPRQPASAPGLPEAREALGRKRAVTPRPGVLHKPPDEIALHLFLEAVAVGIVKADRPQPKRQPPAHGVEGYAAPVALLLQVPCGEGVPDQRTSHPPENLVPLGVHFGHMHAELATLLAQGVDPVAAPLDGRAEQGMQSGCLRTPADAEAYAGALRPQRLQGVWTCVSARLGFLLIKRIKVKEVVLHTRHPF